MTLLINNWQLLKTSSEEYESPEVLSEKNRVDWMDAVVPGTVAQSLQRANQWDLNKKDNFNLNDWWYKSQFKLGEGEFKKIILCFEGLSTICDIWLNGKKIQTTNNMFLEYQFEISKYLKKHNELFLCFRSLNHALSQRWPRPKWKTKLITQQSLRNIRTSLMGHVPGWMPPILPVGPWRKISIYSASTPYNIYINTQLESSTGIVEFSCDVLSISSDFKAVLNVGDTSVELSVENNGNFFKLTGKVEIDRVSLWWPHTHGEPALYSIRLNIENNKHSKEYTLSDIGFKRVDVDQSNDNFIIKINDENIFCRGACWTINDIVSLTGNEGDLEKTLVLMRDAGANMVRIGGTMIYEQDLFYSLCNKLGIMVWQDFMFANMDYPIENDDFLDSIMLEAKQKISTLSKNVCVSIYCGNSEVEQQAAMLGMEKSVWSNTFFLSTLPKLCDRYHNGIPYISSSPSIGVMPFHTNVGVTHYYGVGAYRCSVSELRQHDVRFTSECLGFANIPVSRTRNLVLDGQLPVIHHPKWKERVPRDTGTGWDFEDIRDHYLKEFYGIDPVECRSYAIEKYLAFSEVVTGEIMSQVFSEWRSQYSQCNGGLVWFLKDFLPGAGWGIIDSLGRPKACYYYLKRTWQPINVLITDETLNGLHFHLVNESNKKITAVFELILINESGTTIKTAEMDVAILEKSTKVIQSDEILNGFYDVTYRYRFGPSKHSVVIAQLKSIEGDVLSNSFYFKKPYTFKPYDSVDFIVDALEISEDTYQVNLTSNKFLYGVNVEAIGFIASDNFFNLLPGFKHSLIMKKDEAERKKFRGYVSALNINEAVKIKVNKL